MKKGYWILTGLLLFVCGGLYYTYYNTDVPNKKKHNTETKHTTEHDVTTVEQPTVTERIIDKEVPVEKTVYVDSDGEKINSYWYYSYNTPDGIMGYGAEECSGPYFQADVIFDKIRKYLEAKRGGTYSFIQFIEVFEISKDSYDNAPPDWRE